jgi:hypothetical protein
MEEKILTWWRMNNLTFSAIAGETFTNGQVVLTHIGLAVFIILLGLVGN